MLEPLEVEVCGLTFESIVENTKIENGSGYWQVQARCCVNSRTEESALLLLIQTPQLCRWPLPSAERLCLY